VLVYGLGRSGTAVSRLLREQGHEVFIYDRDPDAEVAGLEALGCRWTERPRDADVTCCIAAPGAPYDHPDLAFLRARGLETIGEVEWVYRSVGARFIGITGTAGKGTVTRWVSDTLSAAGQDAVAGGNIEPALAAVAREGRTLVVELSSFQLERCRNFKPDIAAALNLGADHLDRHGSLSAYHAAKRKLIANLTSAETFIYNRDDALLRDWAVDTPAKTLGYSLTGEADACVRGEGSRAEMLLFGESLLNIAQLQVAGWHNLSNALAVALCCAAAGSSLADIQRGLKSFRGLPGRYSLVGEVGGVRFIEDSIATRVLAVKAALETTSAPIVWLAGGVDKGADFSELKPLIEEKVGLFIGVGQCGADFARKVAPWTQTLVCDSSDGDMALQTAVAEGVDFLHRTRHGGTVLLAPLAASFDQFSDYRQRAVSFRRAVALQMETSSKTPAKTSETSWTAC
jgi:UDP-N-acetylmuramoylalanine--D-glutamate ligase